MARNKAMARVNASANSSQSTTTVTGDTTAPPSLRPSPTDSTTTTTTTTNAPNPSTSPSTVNPVTPLSTASGPPASPISQTLRQKLVAAVHSPKTRKRKRASAKNSEEGEEEGSDDQALQRKLDRLIRWNCFLHFTNTLWDSVAKECYGDDFDIDSDAGLGTRLKIFDSVKGYKNKLLNNMEDHVNALLEAPEHPVAKTLYTTRPLLMNFFSEVFTPGNFFAVWRYMEGYVEYEGSTELGQYYMKSIYVNLAIEVKLYLDICETGIGALDARDRLLKFYDQIPVHPNFDNVDKSDFKEIKKRYRNQQGTPAERSDRILRECFTSIGAPPPKKQALVNSVAGGAGGAEAAIGAGAEAAGQ